MPRKTKPKETIYGNNIKIILDEIGMSQQELADLVGTDASHLSKIISGRRRCISLPIALKISEAMNKPVEDVFMLNEPKQDED